MLELLVTLGVFLAWGLLGFEIGKRLIRRKGTEK